MVSDKIFCTKYCKIILSNKTSLKEFVVVTYRFYLMFKALKMKFILAYVHL